MVWVVCLGGLFGGFVWGVWVWVWGGFGGVCALQGEHVCICKYVPIYIYICACVYQCTHTIHVTYIAGLGIKRHARPWHGSGRSALRRPCAFVARAGRPAQAVAVLEK